MKKKYFGLLFLPLIFLSACQPKATPENPISPKTDPSAARQTTETSTQTPTTPSSEKKESSTDASNKDKIQVSLRKNTKDKIDLIKERISFKDFDITEFEAKTKENNTLLKFELEWENKTSAPASFDDVGKIALRQGDKILEGKVDDDYYDFVKVDDDEDFDGEFKLNNLDPIVLIITDKNQVEKHIEITLVD